MKSLIRIISFIAINLGFVLSKSRKHESGFRGNKNVGIESVCDFNRFCGNQKNTLHEQMHCDLEGIFRNNSNFSGTITFFSNGTRSSLEVIESSKIHNSPGVNSLIIRTVEETINNTISDFLLGNGTLFELNSTQDDSNISFSLESDYELIGDINELSIAYNDLKTSGIGEIVSYNSSYSDYFSNNTLDNNLTDINGDLILDELLTQNLNSTLVVLEEVSEQIPDLRELYKFVRNEQENVSIRDLLKVSTRLMRGLYSTENIEVDESNIEKLRSRLSESEIENLKTQESKVSNTTRPWYEPLKKFGINIITGQNPIFSLIISIVESVIGISPIGSIINIVVRVIAAIVTLITELIQRRKNNSNLIRALRSLDSFDTSPSSKISLANKLIDRININAREIEKSQYNLRCLYNDLSGLAYNADQGLFTLEDGLLREKLKSILNSTLTNMSSSNSLCRSVCNQSRDSLLIKNNTNSRSLMDISSLSARSLLFGYGFKELATDIESYLDESYNLAWGDSDIIRSLNEDVEITANSTNSTSVMGSKPKWYDGLIQFSKKVAGVSGIISMLDMLLELFTVIFANSTQAESILSILKLVVYLIKSVFSIFGNISSSRNLIDITRIIPERIAKDRNLLQLTLGKIQENMNSIEREKMLINSQIMNILEIPILNERQLGSESEGNIISTMSKMETAGAYLINERLLLSSESALMSTEINFKTWMEKVGSFFDSSYDKIKSIIKSIFETIFKGSKIVAFVDRLIDLVISVVRSIYHAFKNKSTQRLLIMSIENCDEPEIQEILYEHLEKTLKNEDSLVMRLLN
ncbi:hypothetical protein FG386_000764 [Cryptosporidium ryanae]|uniref:uncharacterized protein n=1 Tax=Cryptosporidium ryanae TaxID=515981 RepID=UPI00351A0894|nr:hypothetical protein FG386_000764 [Cryptosporidium ryanae]